MDNRYVSKRTCSASSSDIETNMSSNSDSENSQDIGTSFSFCVNDSSSPGYASAESISSVTSVRVRNRSKSARSPKQRTPRTINKMMEMHRQNERNRHHLINTRINTVYNIVPGAPNLERETKVEMMQRIISYVAFLENTLHSVSELLGLAPDPSLSLLLPALYQYAHVGEKSRGKHRRRGKSRRRRMKTSSLSVCSSNSSSTDGDAPMTELQAELEYLSTQDSGGGGGSATSESPHTFSQVPEGHIPSWFFEDSHSPEELTLDLLDGSDVDSDVFSMTSADTLISPSKLFSSSRQEGSLQSQAVSQPLSPRSQRRMEHLASFVEEEGLEAKQDPGPKADRSDVGDTATVQRTPEKLSGHADLNSTAACDYTVVQPSRRELPRPFRSEHTALKSTAACDYTVVQPSWRELPRPCSPKPCSPSPCEKASGPARKPVGKRTRRKKYTRVRVPLGNLTNREPCQNDSPPQSSTPSESYRKLRSKVFQKEDSAFVHDMPLQSAQTHMALARRQKVLTARENDTDSEPEPPVEKVKEPTKPQRVDQRRASWMNGFMMFSRLNRRLFIESNPGIHTSHISKMMGHHWRNMSKVEQMPFNLKAKAFALEMQKTLTASLSSSREGELDEGEGRSRQPEEGEREDSSTPETHSITPTASSSFSSSSSVDATAASSASSQDTDGCLTNSQHSCIATDPHLEAEDKSEQP